jgi:hypothetical protein
MRKEREEETGKEGETPTRGPIRDLPTQRMVEEGGGEETVWPLSPGDYKLCLSIPWLPNDGICGL